jgi:hypothetical protein
MDETDFEGTLVLEQLAAIDEVEDFVRAATREAGGRRRQGCGTSNDTDIAGIP